MEPKKKSNKNQKKLEPTNVIIKEPEPVVFSNEERMALVERDVLEPVSQVNSLEKPKKIDLEINEIFNPLLSNDLEILLKHRVERPKSPPPKRFNRHSASIGMRFNF